MGNFSGALFKLTVLLQFNGYMSSGSDCYELQYSYYYSYYTYYGYCSFGCCGYTTSRYCCTSFYYPGSDDSVIGVIVGATVGSVVFFVVMVTGICCVCKNINKNKVNRVMVGPASSGPQGVAIVSNRMNIPMQQPIPGQIQGYLPQGYQAPQGYQSPQGYQAPQAPQAFYPQSYPPPIYHSTVPIQQPGNSSDPIPQSSNIPSAWNNTEPGTTQEKH